MSITSNLARVGCATSSTIGILAKGYNAQKNTFDETAMQYISEMVDERRLGVCLENDTNALALTWGKVCEIVAFTELLDCYNFTAEKTDVHRFIKCWAGSKDGNKFEENRQGVFDVKCPITRKSFTQLVQPWMDGKRGMDYINAVRFGYTDRFGIKRKKHPKGEEYYWQLVSNMILSKSVFCELIVFMPFKDELENIKAMCEIESDVLKNIDTMRIKFAKDGELPFLERGNFYVNLNIMEFTPPKEDVSHLTKCMKAVDEIMKKAA